MHEQSINYYPTYVKNNSCIVHQMNITLKMIFMAWVGYEYFSS